MIGVIKEVQCLDVEVGLGVNSLQIFSGPLVEGVSDRVRSLIIGNGDWFW